MTTRERAPLGRGTPSKVIRVAVAPAQIQAVRWDGRRLSILDQTLLPGAETWLSLTGARDTADAIARLAVRGAPNIGIAAAYGLAMEVAARPSLGALEEGAEILLASRPTAVNLAWAVERVRSAALGAGPSTLASAARAEAPRVQPSAAAARGAEAQRVQASEDAASVALATAGADVLDGARTLLTHCNTGGLATGGRGSAL